MLKREAEWAVFVLFITGLASLLAFRGAMRSWIDFSFGSAVLSFGPITFAVVSATFLMGANFLFAWMVRIGNRDVRKVVFLKRFFGVVAATAGGAAVAVGVQALPAFTTQGYEELAKGSVAVVVLLAGVVLMALFRGRELPVPPGRG